MSTEVLNKLLEFSEAVNIADLLDSDKLREIADRVKRGYEVDKLSMESFLEQANQAVELCKLEREEKNYPMRKASNVKLPMITQAAMQFTSRTLPELIKSGKLAKYRIIGPDPTGAKARRGKRLETHLNWQMLEQMKGMLDELDNLLMQTSIVGTTHAKTYFDPVAGTNRFEFIPYDEFVINAGVKTLEEAERKTQILSISEKELIENQRFGIYRHFEKYSYDGVQEQVEDKDGNSEGFADSPDADPVNVQELLEQHCFLDLDEDGMPEPYIVTMHEKSGQVLRIVARYIPAKVVVEYDGIAATLDELIVPDPDDNTRPMIRSDIKGKCEVKKIHAIEYFTKFGLIPNPDGGYFMYGLGTLLLDLNMTANTISNQLIDAGRLANLQGGFIGSRLRIRGDTKELEPGEWVKAESADGNSLRNEIVPLNYKEPSTVLFQMLGTIYSMGQQLASSTEVLTGTAETQNSSPHTVLAMIQQGLQQFLSMQRRILRSYKDAFQKLVDLNRIFLDSNEYLQVLDIPPESPEFAEMLNPRTGEILDYALAGDDVVPVADLKNSTEAEKLAKLQVMIQNIQFLGPLGATNGPEFTRFMAETLELDNPERFMPPPQDPMQNPEFIKMQADIAKQSAELELKELELKRKAMETELKGMKMKADAVKAIAEAEAAEAGSQLQMYKAFADSILQEQSNIIELEKARRDNEQAQPESQPAE